MSKYLCEVKYIYILKQSFGGKKKKSTKNHVQCVSFTDCAALKV